MYKRKKYLEKIIPSIDNSLIKVLTGVRRCGKSTILLQIKDLLIERGVNEENIILYNFESKKYDQLKKGDMLYENVIEISNKISERIYLLFDEIQMVDGWEKVISSFKVDIDCDIFITGSNSKLLSSELATHIAGRYIQFQIYPFSYKEFLLASNKQNNKSELNEYMQYGGFPYASYVDASLREQYLQDVFSTIILKDIIDRHQIKNTDLLNRIIEYIVNNIGATFSATSLSKYFKSENRKVSVDTILNYINYIQETYLISKVQRYDIKGKKILSVNEKYYVVDQGLRNILQSNHILDIEKILENLVYYQLLFLGYKVEVGKINNKEIDFIALKENEKKYIQVTYLLASEETIKREFSVFEELDDNYPCYVISYDDFNFSQKGVHHLNILDFLIMDEF